MTRVNSIVKISVMEHFNGKDMENCVDKFMEYCETSVMDHFNGKGHGAL